MPIVLAGMAATTFGVADFLGGTAARRVPAAVVAMLAQLSGMLLLLALLVLLPATAQPTSLGWGALAGLAGGVGVPLLYRALAVGPMNVVAPLTALTSAGVPVLVGALLGERPSVLAWVGIALAVTAGVVVGVSVQAPDSLTELDTDATAAEGGGDRRVGALRGVLLALFSGLCFGGFFALIAQASPEAGLWPVVTARVAGSLVAGAALLWMLRAGGVTLSPGGRGWRLAAFGGALDALANAFFLLATQHGQLAVVGAIVALYPASTVLLARVLHGERIGRVQCVGLALAVPALVLVSGG